MASDPFEALERLNPLGRQRTQPTPAEMQDDEPKQDRFDRAVAAVDEQRKSAEIRRLQETPADSKRRAQVARELGMKPSEIIDLGRAEQAAKVRRQMEEREKYPAIARLFDKHPDLAVVQLDAGEELSALGRVWEFFSKAPGRTYDTGGRGLGKTFQSAAQELTETFLPFVADVNRLQAGLTGNQENVRKAEEFAAWAQGYIKEGRSRIGFSEQVIEQSSKQYGSDNYWVEAALAGLESVPLTFGAAAATVATRNPYAGAATIGGLVGVDSVQSAKAKGLSSASAYAYGLTHGLAEAAFEAAPMGELLKLGGRSLVSGVGRFLMKEVPGELATTTVQSFTDWAMLPENQSRTFGEWASGLPDELLRTTIGTITGGTVTAGTFRGLDAGTRSVVRFAERRAAQREMAAFGKFEGDWLDMMGKAAGNATLRAENPEAFAELMRDMASQRGVSTVLVPGEAVRDYLQSSEFEGENDPLAPYEQAALDAAMAGNDIAIPIETALTALPGTKAWETLKDDMRLTAGGMSRRQAEALEASEEAMLEEFRQQAEATDSKAKKETTAREARLAKITAKLEEDGGFAPAEAARQAELLVARMTTRAARMGRDGEAVDRAVEGLTIRQVMPPELARAMAAQEKDMVVAALRGNTRGSTSRARAAAAELQAVLKRQGWTPEQLSDEQLGQVIERLGAAGANDGREYRAERGRGSGVGRGQALADAPRVQGEQFGPIESIVAAAEAYAQSVGIDLKRQAEYAKIDEAFATRLAEAYEAAEHNPTDPAVAEAYEDLIRQTRAQYDALVAAGITFSFGDPDGPYFKSGWNALRDLRDNGRMQVFATKDGYGSDEEFNASDNPLLVDTGLTWPDAQGVEQIVYANDLFRAVHDAFGHGVEGAGFRAEGEENAWQAHARLFTGPALAALTSETRGQNSWVNYGPNGEFNRTASAEDTIYADQKAAILPSWAWTENVVPDMERDYEQQATAERLGERGDVSGIGDVGVDARTVFPNLDRPPVNEDGTVTLDHFTGEKGLTQTDPAAWGRSGKFLPDSERARIGTAPGRTYFGIATQRGGYVNEFRDGKHPRTKKPIQRLSARIPFDRLYDMYGDPDGLKEVGRALPKNEQGKYIYNGKPVDGVSLYELLIRDAGYAGYWTPALGLTAAVFEPVEVQPYVPERDDYQPEGPREFRQESLEKPMVVVHNLSAENFREAQALGGLAAPSIAVIRADLPFDGFGEITLIAAPELATQGKAFASDVYSPRQPRAQYDLSRPVLTKVKQDAAQALTDLGISEFSEFASDQISREGLAGLERSLALKLTFLRSIGQDVKIVLEEKPKVDPRLRPFTKKHRDAFDMSNDPAFVAVATEIFNEEIAQAGSPEAGEAWRSRYFDADGTANFRWVRQLGEQALKASRPRRINLPETRRRIEKRLNATNKRQRQFKEWIAKEYGGLLAGRFFLDNNGRRQPYTMERVLRNMTRTVRDGEGFNYGMGSLRSRVTPQLRSLKAIKERRDKLISEEDMEAVKAEIEGDFEALIERMRPYHPSGVNANSFSFHDIATDFLKDLAAGRISEWQTSIFKEPLPQEIVTEAREFLQKLKEAPTEYFEVKMQRAVDFREFEAAVVPSDAPQDVVDELRGMGLRIETYDRAGRGEARAAAVMRVGQRQFFQSPQVFEQATWFYSALERAAEAVKTERAPAAQWIATLKNAPGVKAEELDSTGVLDWLGILSGSVDKAQVIEFLQRGGITIEEIAMTGEPTMEVSDVLEVYEEEIDSRAQELANEEFEDDFSGTIYETVREELIDVDRETPDLFDPEIGPPYQPRSAYAYSANFSMKYTDLDSDRMERYMADFDPDVILSEDGAVFDLGTFSTREEAQAALDKVKDDLRDYLFEYEDFGNTGRESAEAEFIERYANGGGDETRYREYSWSSRGVGLPDTYTELLLNFPLGEGGNPKRGFTGNHWRESGNLLHIRFFEAKGEQGQRQFVWEEAQADIHKIANDRFNAVKTDQVSRFIALARVGELEGARESAAYDAANEQMKENPKQVHKVWPEVSAWLRENGGDLGNAMLQAVEDANEGYASEPSPGKVAQAETNLANANESLEVVSATHTEALAALQAAAKPLAEAWEAEYEGTLRQESEKLRVLEDEYSTASRERFLELRPLVATQRNVVDRIKMAANRLSLAVNRAPDTLNFRDIMFALDGVLTEDQLVEFKASKAYIRAYAAENRWQAAITLSNLREQELDLARNGGNGIPMFPFKKTWIDLALKRVVHWAAAEGFDEVVWINGDQVNGGRVGEDFTWLYGKVVPNTVSKLFKKHGVKVEGKRVDGMPSIDTPRMDEVRERMAEIDKMVGGQMSGLWGAGGAAMAERIAGIIPLMQAELERNDQTVAMLEHQGAQERKRLEAGVPENELDFSLSAHDASVARKKAWGERARAAIAVLSDTEQAMALAAEYTDLRLELNELARTNPTNLGFTITPELREAAASGFPLFQGDHKKMPRARVLFPDNDDQGAVIELFQGRDLSSVAHEGSHIWLEELKADAADPNAPEQIKRDWQAVQDWWRASGYEVRDGVIPVGAHEMFARTGERYMREGKAPSVELKRTFEAFRGWLTNLYKSVRDLLRYGPAPITPEIREVFDRLLATDEQIAEARQMQGMDALFNTAVEAGMSPDEFANYQEQVASARAEAQGKVLEKAMADIARRETRLGRERRRQIKDQVSTAIEDTPLFKALAALREERMDRATLVERFGEEVVGQLPSRVPPLYAEAGVDPEIIAERAGFNSAQAMVETMVAAEAEQRAAKEGGDKRSLKARMIDQMTDAAMAAQYGDTMTPEQMREEAMDAVANDRQGEVIASEIAALARKTGKGPTPYQMARQWARGRVRQGTYVAEASKQALERHRRAIAAAGREAEQALLAGDMEAVYRAKQKQMLSAALLSEAKKANEEVDVARARMDRIARARTMKSVDQEYLEQAHSLLEEVDLKQRSQTSIDEKLGFDDWLASRGDGEEVVVPDRLNWKGQPWSRLTVEQIMGLDDTIKSIIHLGRFKQTMLDNQERREFEAWRDEARAGLEETPGRKVDEAALNQEKRRLASIFANLAKMEVIAAEMDNDKPGVWTRLLTWRASDAANYRDEMRDRVLVPIAAAYNALDNAARKRLSETVEAPGLLWKSPDINDPRNGTPIKLTRWNVLAMALNTGNQSSLEKLARGYGISTDYAEAITMQHLNEQEWQFVQTVWDSLELLWPDIEKAERTMSGVAPERVEVRPIRTPFGELRGGYYPVVYDPASSQRAEDNLNDATADLFGKRSGVSTSSGHTKARTGYAAPILLSPEGVLFQHVEKVITRNAYAPWVRDVLRAIKEPSLRALIDRKMGPEFRQQIEPWLRQQVREGVANEAMTGVEAFLRSARVNVTVVSMGLRWSTGVAQIIGLGNSIARVGLTGMQRGFRKMLQNPAAAQEFVFSRSPEMARRNEQMNRDVAEAFRVMRLQARGGGPIKRTLKGWQSKAQTMAFWHIGMIDRWIVSTPTWLGAYENAIREGKTDEEATRAGDSAVRLSQGSGVEKDLSAWQSNQSSEALKFLTMFYTPFNVLLNAQWEATRSVRRGDWRKASMITFWMLIATPLFDALLAGDVPDDDDEEGWASWLARNVGTYQMAGIPIVRDVGNYAERKMIGEYANFNPGPLTRIFTSSERAAQLAWDSTLGEDEISDTWLRTAIETPGFFLGLPTGQVSQTSQFLYDVGQGTQNPRDFSDWYQGLTKGKIKED
jgi:hypothetical protein